MPQAQHQTQGCHLVAQPLPWNPRQAAKEKQPRQKLALSFSISSGQKGTTLSLMLPFLIWPTVCIVKPSWSKSGCLANRELTVSLAWSVYWKKGSHRGTDQPLGSLAPDENISALLPFLGAYNVLCMDKDWQTPTSKYNVRGLLVHNIIYMVPLLYIFLSI